MRWSLIVLLVAGCGLKTRPAEPTQDEPGPDDSPADAGSDGGTVGTLDAGPDAGTFEDAGTPPADAGTDAGIAVTPIAFDWYVRGAVDEYSIASAASGENVIWLRYVLASSGVITTLRRNDGQTMATQPHDLAPVNVVSQGDQVAFIGRGVSSVSDWRVLWMSGSGAPVGRSPSMNLAISGGIVASTMFRDAAGNPVVHALGSRDSNGTHVTALVEPDGGVRRAEYSCGPTTWWDAATTGDSMQRFFIGAVQAQPCNLGDGQYVAPAGGDALRWVLVRYQGDVASAGGVPTVRQLPMANGVLPGPAALGATESAVWVAYYSATSHLRLQRYSVGSMQPDVAAVSEATGSAFVTGTAALALTVGDVVPHPSRDRVYVLATVSDSKASWAGETLPALTVPTLAVFVFDRSARLLEVRWLPSASSAKSASSMALIDERLVVSGQCDSPSGLTPQSEPLCPSASSTPVSFLFGFPAP